MLTRKQNELLTRTGPGTPLGDLMRRYWVPACLSERLPEPGGAPIRLKLLGEPLVAFRDTEGVVGLMDEFCPHRGASLVYARNEDCGLRCIYHGWLIDRHGTVLDVPGERRGQNFARKIRQPAYPTREVNGVVWAYLGPPEKMPPFPEFLWTKLQENHLLPIHLFQECNYLQGIEGDLDITHGSYLHYEYDKRSGWKRTDATFSAQVRRGRAMAHDRTPRIYAEDTNYGVKSVWIHQTEEEEDVSSFWIHPFIMPFYTIVAGAEHGPHLFHAWVPIDDESHWLWYIHFDPEKPLTESARESIMTRFGHEWGPGYVPAATLANGHLQDRDLMRSENYSGMRGLQTQDMAVCAGMGPIVDRTKEHLGEEDAGVIKVRRYLLRAIKNHQQGQDPPGLDPAIPYDRISGIVRFLPSDLPWRDVFKVQAKLGLI